MERRFSKIELAPSEEILKNLLTDSSMAPVLMGRVIKFFNIAKSECPHGFGHTYFLGVTNPSDLIRLWNHNLRFLFKKIFQFEESKYGKIKGEYAALFDDPPELF